MFNKSISLLPYLRLKNVSHNHLSTKITSNSYRKEPWKHVIGVSKSDLLDNPCVSEYFAANSEYFSNNDTSKREQNKTVAPQDPLEKVNIRKLTTYLREEKGTNACYPLRRNKMIPGLVHGQHSPKAIERDPRIFVKTPWNEIEREFDRYSLYITGRVYELSIYQDNDTFLSKLLVVPNSLQLHPYKKAMFCLNFVRYYPGRTIDIPVQYVNEEESPALKQGGLIIPIKRTVSCVAEDGAYIPDFLDVDCTNANRGVLKLDRIQLPHGISYAKNVDVNNLFVGTVYGKMSIQSEEETSE